MKQIKICGIRRLEDISYVNQELPEYIGFIFANTRRYIDPTSAKILKEQLDPSIKAIGVFVNETIETIEKIVENQVIDIVQLHGDEDQSYILELKEKVSVPIWKAVRAKDSQTIGLADQLPVDGLLIDSYAENSYGGTGKTFSWSIIPSDLKHSYFLAGGLSVENIESAKDVPCCGYDISGGVETDGVKDLVKIKKLIEMIRRNNIE